MKLFVKILLLSALMSSSLMATKPGYYNDYAHEMSKKFYDILISAGDCLNLNECKKKEYFLYVGSNDNLDIEFYEVINPDILKEIMNVLFIAFKENEQKMSISLSCYQQAHKDVVNFGLFTKKDPFLQLRLKGDTSWK